MDYKAKIKELEEKNEKLMESFSKAIETDDETTIDQLQKSQNTILRLKTIYQICDKFNVSEEESTIYVNILDNISSYGTALSLYTMTESKMNKDHYEEMCIKIKPKIEENILSLDTDKKIIFSKILNDKIENYKSLLTSKYARGVPVIEVIHAYEFAQESLENSLLPKNEGTAKNDGEGK